MAVKPLRLSEKKKDCEMIEKMGESEKCPIYAKGEAEEWYFLGKVNVICSLRAKDCPYGKGLSVNFEGDPVTVCSSGGLVEIIDAEKVGSIT